MAALAAEHVPSLQRYTWWNLVNGAVTRPDPSQLSSIPAKLLGAEKSGPGLCGFGRCGGLDLDFLPPLDPCVPCYKYNRLFNNALLSQLSKVRNGGCLIFLAAESKFEFESRSWLLLGLPRQARHRCVPTILAKIGNMVVVVVRLVQGWPPPPSPPPPPPPALKDRRGMHALGHSCQPT